MNKGLFIGALLSLISAIIQLLAVISVPITSQAVSYDIYLAKYNGIAFGVFGICDYNTNVCSPPRIGYPPENQLLGNNESGGVQLPSNARYSISKLLVVHVMAFALTCVLVVVTFVCILVLWIKEIKFHRHIKKTEAEANRDTPDVSDSKLSEKTAYPKKSDLTPFLNFQLTFSLLSCLLTLLGLLSDVILFLPHLSYLGWMQIIPIIFLGVTGTLVCFMRRSIFSRRHLDEQYFYANDDMRLQGHGRIDDPSDTASDDGFYVYTNGFYSSYGDREYHNRSQQSNSNSWRRHTPNERDERDEEASFNSSQLNREEIQLSDLNRNSTDVQ